ncbi:MAG: DUF5694 domain-containing protein [Dysgonamonadaceae bacterium]|nr:DUF5694 domain-containing protein [Dysgonamonadaceae bacterium]
MKKILFTTIFLSYFCLLNAQISEIELFKFQGKHQPRIMILGTFHFGASHDMRQSEDHFDILSEQRQEEISVLLNLLKEYKPTKIMFENDRIEHDSIYNTLYKKHLSDEFDISKHRGEDFQLGFRLAKMMNHDRIYLIDARSTLPTTWCGFLDCNSIDIKLFESGLSYTELQRALGTERQFERSKRHDVERFYHWQDSMKNEMTLVDYLTMMNTPNYLLKQHQANIFGMPLIGAGINYFGADHIANWYRRDIRIFSNVHDIADFDTEERLLLIIGASHVWPLRQLFSDYPDFNYVEINDYLKSLNQN